jgi:hypothetical protein
MAAFVIFNMFQRIMDYMKLEVLITPATLQIQSPEKQTSWSLLGPGVEVGLTPSFIDYVRLSLM